MFEEPVSGDVKIQAYLDRNLIFEFNDTANQFNDGNFGFITSAASIGTIDEVELFEQPLSTELIDKTFTL